MSEPLTVDARVAARDVHVQFDVAAGDVVALIGPNGAGKSTTIHLLAGALRPESGAITLGPTTLAGPHAFVPPHRRKIGYLEQRALLFPHLNVLDNVAYGPRCWGASRQDARRRAASELAAVGLAGFETRPVGTLSGGQAQRVALARSLACDPDVVLLDEPFAALDATTTPALRHLLRGRLRGITTLIATHDPLDVMVLADRVVALEHGRVTSEGSVEEMVARPSSAFLADFVGLNLLTGRAEGTQALALSDGSLISGLSEAPLPEGGVRAVFAPDAVSLFTTPPHGSPRTALRAVVSAIEDRGMVQRVSLLVAGQRIHADVTPAAVRDLGLTEGDPVVAAIKATQVALHPVPAR